MLKSATTLYFPAALLLVWVFVGTTALAEEKKEAQAPDVTLETLDGKKVNLEEFRGKYLVVNFWATWCGPCKIEMPSLEDLYQRFKSSNFALVAISNDIFGRTVVQPFVEANNISFPILLDPDMTASSKFGVVSLPTTFLIDPQGKIIGVLQGAEDWSNPQYQLYFENLLQQG